MENFYAFASRTTQIDTLVKQIKLSINALLEQQHRVTLAVSGGKSPQPLFTQLSQQTLDWSRIQITLVDDRWLDDSMQDSNAYLVKKWLLKNDAQHVLFYPLVNVQHDPEKWAQQLAITQPKIDIALLGMGEDGHTASLFSDCPQWEKALISNEKYLIMQPNTAKYQRISLSFQALCQIRTVFLVITGTSKKAVFLQAQRTIQNNAISQLLHRHPFPIQTYWSL